MKLYTYSIDVDTLKIEVNTVEYDYYNEDLTGWANYEEYAGGAMVYAESLVSVENSRR